MINRVGDISIQTTPTIDQIHHYCKDKNGIFPLFTNCRYTIPAGNRTQVWTGIKVRLRKLRGQMMGIYDLAAKNIDVVPVLLEPQEDFRSIWLVVINNSSEEFDIKAGERIGTLIVEEVWSGPISWVITDSGRC